MSIIIAENSATYRNRRIRFLLRSGVDPLADDGPNVVANLRRSPKKISSVYVYDRAGTEWFERQCETPEYYLRRAEAGLLERHAAEILEQCGHPALVELGAGTAQKTRVLLGDYAKRGYRCDYYPIDVDIATLSRAAEDLASAFPQLFIHCLGATYGRALRAVPASPQGRLYLFLGSSIGNMECAERDLLLAELYRRSRVGDHFLVGADLDKDPAVIDRAYNDAAGHGRRSSLNVLSHLNRRYRGNFIIDQFAYRSHYDASARRNEIRIESLADQVVELADLRLRVAFTRAELIDAEVMFKFDPDELARSLERAGFESVRRWIDPAHHYGLFMLRRKA